MKYQNNENVKSETVSIEKLFRDSVSHYAPSGNILDIIIVYVKEDKYPVKITYIYQ